MSRHYQVSIEVKKLNKKRKAAIQEAASKLFPFEEWGGFHDIHGSITLASADGNLGESQSEKEFSERLARVIFIANLGSCEISIKMTPLDDLPYETYNFGEKEYKSFHEEYIQLR